jgi:hypothetical protein
VLSAQGNLPAALDSFKASLAIADRLAAADPGNAGWQHDLAIGEGRAGMVLARTGKCDAALDALRRGRAIISRLGELSPDYAVLANDMAWFDLQITEVVKINLRV